MKTQTQKIISFPKIIATIEGHELKEAREILAHSNGAALECTGRVEKVVKRHGGLRLFIKPELDPNLRPMMLFAEFSDEKERQKALNQKVRKGMNISITGKFRTAGYQAVTMDGCRLKEILGTKK